VLKFTGAVFPGHTGFLAYATGRERRTEHAARQIHSPEEIAVPLLSTRRAWLRADNQLRASSGSKHVIGALVLSDRPPSLRPSCLPLAWLAAF
jgi:hypothetical protein